MKEFYPRLFKKLNEVSVSAIKDWIATTPTSDIRIDPNVDDDKILMVDRKKPEDIITKDYIESISKIKVKNDLMTFLKKSNPEITLDNVDEYEIPLGDFWQYQVDMFKYEKGGGDEEYDEETGEPEENPMDDIDQKSVEVLTQFFDAAGKKESFLTFYKNIPNGAIRHQVDRLFELMAKIILGKDDVITEKLFDHRLSLTKADQQKWKDDMIKYLYSMHDIEEMSQDNFYSGQVLNKDTFIRAIFDAKAPGIGRGELMMCYLFNGAKAAGGDVDYDLVFYNGRTYEVKEYLSKKEGKGGKESAGESIRLGKGGKMAQFPAFEEVWMSVITAKRLYERFKDELKENINPVFFQLWTYMQNSEMSGKSYDKAIALAVGTGELSNANLNRIILWNYFANDLITKKDPAIPSVIIDKLSDLYYVNNPDKLKEDFDKTPERYFAMNKGLDAFVIFRPTKINICHPEDLKYATISQSGIKFIEKGEEGKQPSVADSAYSKWKSEITKAIQDAETAEDKESLKDVMKTISFADFYEKEGHEEHIAKVEKKEQEKSAKKIADWEKRYNQLINNPKKSQKEKDKWLKNNPDPRSVKESVTNFYPRLSEYVK